MTEKAQIFYHDIGDYLSREEKLAIVKKYGSISNVDWQELHPNEHGDWINQRNDAFGNFIPLGDKDDKNTFWRNGLYCRGLETSRDVWLYNSNKELLKNSVTKTVNFYNAQ